jgi:hypothetical protein
MDEWFWLNFSDTKMNHAWRAGVDYVLDKLDPQYVSHIHGRAQNIRSFVSPFYYIGDAIVAKSTIPLSNSANTHRSDLNDTRPHLIRGKLVVY